MAKPRQIFGEFRILDMLAFEQDAVKALLEAKKPVIWAGRGVLFADATAELKELAELTGIPVFCTMPGKSAFDERHPLSLGAGSGATTLPARQWLQECDVLLALGSSLTRSSYGQPIAPGQNAQFRVAFEPSELIEYSCVIRILSNDIHNPSRY